MEEFVNRFQFDRKRDVSTRTKNHVAIICSLFRSVCWSNYMGFVVDLPNGQQTSGISSSFKTDNKGNETK